VKNLITREKISSFDPFNMKGFKCPVCGSSEFVELHPYGGVWCRECNAEFFVRGTCDGINKIAVDCFTKYVFPHKRKSDMLEYYWTVIWRDDEEIVWLGKKGDEIVTVET